MTSQDAYREGYLRSPHWQAKRREVYAAQHRHCSVCRRGNIPLDVHHQTYERLGNEDIQDLILLCRDCHDEVHRYRKSNPHIALRRAVKRVRQRRYRA